MSLAILFHFLCTQHVSDINTSIIRSLRLCCWITTSVVLFLVRCVLEIWCGWVWVVSVLQAEAQVDDDCRPYHHHHCHHYHYYDHYHYPKGWTDKLSSNVCYLGFDVVPLNKCSQCFDLSWHLLPSTVKQPWSFKMLGTTYLTMQCCRPEELSPKPHCCLNLRYYDPV